MATNIKRIFLSQDHFFFTSVQFNCHYVQLFATPWTVACQASLSITNFQSVLKLMSIESLMPSNHLILCHPPLLLPAIFPSTRVFLMSQFFTFGGQSIGVSASASVLPMNIQGWFPEYFFILYLNYSYNWFYLPYHFAYYYF